MIKICISVTSHVLDPLPLSQTVTPSRTPSPSSVTYFMYGPLKPKNVKRYNKMQWQTPMLTPKLFWLRPWICGLETVGKYLRADNNMCRNSISIFNLSMNQKQWRPIHVKHDA